MKRLLAVATFFALAAFACAQSTLSGTVFSQTFTGGTTGSGFIGSGAYSAIDYSTLGSSFQPSSYSGSYSLSVTISADASNDSAYWKGTSALTAYYKIGTTTYTLGTYSLGADGTQTFTSTFLSSTALNGATNVYFTYSDFSLGGSDTLKLTSTYSLTAVPEPATYALLLGVGTLGLVGYRRFRRK